MKNLLRYSLLAVLLSPLVTKGQDSVSFTEQVYLHSDQETYLTGEYIWISAYVTNQQQTFSSLSKVLYIEVLDQENKPVLQAKISLEAGRGHGSLFIPASLTSGIYSLRAYTNWMRNRPAGHFFHKSLRILNPFIPLAGKGEPQTQEEVRVDFFPEGGTWVRGIPGRIGFHVTDAAGIGIPFRGVVINSAGDTAAFFSPERFGRGHFDLIPGEGNYQAIIKDVFDSLITRVTLPEPANRGMTLLADRTRSGYSVSIACTDCQGVTPVILEIRGVSGQTSETRVSLSGGMASLPVRSDQLSDGLNWLTLRNEYGSVLARRALFRYPDLENTKLQINPGQTSVREEVSYLIEAPEGSSLSVSIYRKDELYRSNARPMVASLYLNQALGQPVEDPDFFFNPGSAAALEDLLRMQKYQEPDTGIEFLPELRGQLVTAYLMNGGSRKPANIPVYMSLPGNPFVFRVGLTDSTGTVRFQAGDVQGQRTLILLPVLPADSMLVFRTAPVFSESYAPGIRESLTLDPGTKEALEARSLGMQMNNIYHGEERARLQTNLRDTLPFYGNPTHQYRLDDYTRFPSMLDVIKEYVYTVAARRRDKAYVLRVLDMASNGHFDMPPLTLLDGVPIVNHDKLIRYDPLNVEKIDVIAGKYVFGPIAFPGIVSFSTYDRNLKDFTLSSSVMQVDYEGIQFQRTFYIPDYSLPENRRKPDMRALLLWEPDLRIGSSGRHEGTFRTSDRPGTYIMVVEGMSQEGKPVYEETQFEVIPDLRSRN